MARIVTALLYLVGAAVAIGVCVATFALAFIVAALAAVSLS